MVNKKTKTKTKIKKVKEKEICFDDWDNYRYDSFHVEPTKWWEKIILVPLSIILTIILLPILFVVFIIVSIIYWYEDLED